MLFILHFIIYLPSLNVISSVSFTLQVTETPVPSGGSKTDGDGYRGVWQVTSD